MAILLPIVITVHRHGHFAGCESRFSMHCTVVLLGPSFFIACSMCLASMDSACALFQDVSFFLLTFFASSSHHWSRFPLPISAFISSSTPILCSASFSIFSDIFSWFVCCLSFTAFRYSTYSSCVAQWWACLFYGSALLRTSPPPLARTCSPHLVKLFVPMRVLRRPASTIFSRKLPHPGPLPSDGFVASLWCFCPLQNAPPDCTKSDSDGETKDSSVVDSGERDARMGDCETT